MSKISKSYSKFIKSKLEYHGSFGFDIGKKDINPMLFDFQKDIVKWALKKGRAALFTMTGTGKTPMQLEWGNLVNKHTGGDILILAPLAVSKQTQREGDKFGIKVNICRTQKDVKTGLNITNYEMLSHFNPSKFTGIVLDESSILKSYDSKTRTEIIEAFAKTSYRLACTATPSPNDYMELGNHSEFLGVMSRTEMLSMFFVHDMATTQKWRLKRHAEDKYWEWLSSWAVVLTKPSDLGYEDNGFILPPLVIKKITIPFEGEFGKYLFPMPAETLIERRQARKQTTSERVLECAKIANKEDGTFLVWCDLNYESDMLRKKIKDSVEVKGSDSREFKEKALLGFAKGDIRVLVTKPSIAGFGMNWQHCNNMAFVGLSDSFEQYFQAVRRCWRFGQTKPVNVYIITSELEGNVVRNIKRKEQAAEKMIDEMVVHTQNIIMENIQNTKRELAIYNPTIEMKIPNWLMEEV